VLLNQLAGSCRAAAAAEASQALQAAAQLEPQLRDQDQAQPQDRDRDREPDQRDPQQQRRTQRPAAAQLPPWLAASVLATAAYASAPCPASWFTPYLGLQQLLQGACQLLGSCFGLHLQLAPAGRGGGAVAAWAQHCWQVSVRDAATGQLLGEVLVLLDARHLGNPFCTMLRHGRRLAGGCVQPAWVAVMLPGHMGSSHDGSGSAGEGDATPSTTPSSRSSSKSVAEQPHWSGAGLPSAGGSWQAAAAGAPQQPPAAGGGAPPPSARLPARLAAPAGISTLLHELGHALHFVLSSASNPGLTDAANWLHPEGAELPAHLVERFARDPRSLQVCVGGGASQRARPPARLPARPPARSPAPASLSQPHLHADQCLPPLYMQCQLALLLPACPCATSLRLLYAAPAQPASAARLPPARRCC